jgi:hypothetical protein
MPTLSVNTKSGLYAHIELIVERYGDDARVMHDNHPHLIVSASRSKKPHHVDINLKRIEP